MKYKLISTICLSFLLLFITCCGETSKTIDSASILYSVGDYKVSFGEAMLFIDGQQEFTEGNYGSMIWNVNIGDQSFSDFLSDKIKNHIALVYAGAALAKNQGISLSSEDKTLAESAANYFYSGLSETQREEFDLDINKIQNAFSAYRLARTGHEQIVDEAGIEVSQDEARVMVLAQIRVYTTGLSEEERVVKKEKINIVTEKLAAGEDFVTLAGLYNEADKIQETVSRDDLPESEEKIAFSLAYNEVSLVHETTDGYFIFKCLKTNDQTLSAARRQTLLETAKEEYYITHINSFLSQNSSDWNDDVWNNIDIEKTNSDFKFDFYSVYEMFFVE